MLTRRDLRRGGDQSVQNNRRLCATGMCPLSRDLIDAAKRLKIRPYFFIYFFVILFRLLTHYTFWKFFLLISSDGQSIVSTLRRSAPVGFWAAFRRRGRSSVSGNEATAILNEGRRDRDVVQISVAGWRAPEPISGLYRSLVAGCRRFILALVND